MKKSDDKNKGFLGFVERIGNKLPNPATLFIYLSIVVMIISFILAKYDVSATYKTIDSKTNEITETTVNAVNLLSKDSLREFVSSILTNFTNFFALRTVFVDRKSVV